MNPGTVQREHVATFRFYAELNDFLTPGRRGVEFEFQFDGHPGIKDPIEALGIPHTEVELLLVNGEPCGFDKRLRHGDRVAVYPFFSSIDLASCTPLRAPPPRCDAFVLDAHLGKLARLLRLLGLDVLYRNDYQDPEVVDIGVRDSRIILTRDRRLLFHRRIVHGCFIRSDQPERQVSEVVTRYRLASSIRPFGRCMVCNGHVEAVAREAVQDMLPPKTRRYYDEFRQCDQCGKVYWRGPHFDRLQQLLRRLDFPASPDTSGLPEGTN